MHIRIRCKEDLTEHSHAYLFMLYQPLIGLRACALYEILSACSGQQMDDSALKRFSGLTNEQIKTAQKQLEQFALLETYKSDDSKKLIFVLHPPLNPRKFLNHPIYSRYFIQHCSAEQYKQLVDLYQLNDQIPDNYTNLTASMNLAKSRQEPEPVLPHPVQNYTPNQSDLERYPFDWTTFFSGMNRTIPERLRTKDNMARIAFLSHYYGLNELDLRKTIIRGISSDRTTMNFDLIISILESNQKTGSRSQTHKNRPESPVEHLKNTLPEHVDVLDTDRKTLALLSSKYHFSDEIINLMIDQTLNACQQRLNSRYIQKMADTWHRAKINTLEQAKEYTKRPAQPSQPTASLPDWYYKQDPGKADEATIKELEELLNQPLSSQQKKNQ